MGEDDQKYRWQIMFGELDEKKIDSLKKLKLDAKLEHIHRALSYQIGFSKQVRDSLFDLQNIIDYQNKEQFIAIIKQFGYPSKKRVKSQSSSYLILHFTQPEDFDYFFPIFTSELLKGNMPPKEFASWYDRCQLFMHKKKLYGEYDNRYPCVEDLNKTNQARKNIGLKPIRKNKCK
jgi:hypothetical protein